MAASAVLWAAAASRSRAAALPEPILTHQTLFSIPFTLPPAGDPALDPVEVRLYASNDVGATWVISGHVEPKARSFTFQAPRDGEYWFVIRTVDRQGRIHPEKAEGPELRVLVDTQPPRLELSAMRSPKGDILVRWAAFDPLLKPDSLKLDYQQAGDPSWPQVAAMLPTSDPTKSSYNGEVSFRPARTGPLTIRGQISDRAGNTATATATVVADSPSDPFPGNGGATPGGTPWPADGSGPSLTAPTGSGAIHTAPSSNPNLASNPWSSAGTSVLNAGPAMAAPTGPVESRVNPAVASRVGPGDVASAFADRLPRGERPYMVNSHKFALEYEVESVGSSGISKIEIWGTRDGGRNWQSYGVEPNTRGPLKVAVDGEGLYGFRITVQDGNGFGGQPPRAGDLPELWVGVDLTKPNVKLAGVDLGNGTHAGELQIRWEATDMMLAARPITILFSEHPGGPWSTIAAGLENTGSFVWRFDNRVPDRIHLRLEARDEAGNIGVFETAEPVSLNPSRPQGHLREVHPLTDDASPSASRVQVYEFYR